MQFRNSKDDFFYDTVVSVKPVTNGTSSSSARKVDALVMMIAICTQKSCFALTFVFKNFYGVSTRILSSSSSLVDWKHALDTFGVWNIDKDHDSLLEPAFAGDNSLLFRVSCHRTSTYMKRHEFTSVDAEDPPGRSNLFYSALGRHSRVFGLLTPIACQNVKTCSCMPLRRCPRRATVIRTQHRDAGCGLITSFFMAMEDVLVNGVLSLDGRREITATVGDGCTPGSCTAIGEGIHYLFGWPASMRLYDLEVVAWIRDAEILLAIALLPNWNRKKKESLPVCCPQDGSSPVSDLVGPLFKTRKTTELGETKLRPRPSRVDSQESTSGDIIETQVRLF
eukprot:Gb_32438 [translate_table: standard]